MDAEINKKLKDVEVRVATTVRKDLEKEIFVKKCKLLESTKQSMANTPGPIPHDNLSRALMGMAEAVCVQGTDGMIKTLARYMGGSGSEALQRADITHLKNLARVISGQVQDGPEMVLNSLRPESSPGSD